jgi:peptide/nickel transport system substrate-binding protein
MRLRFITQSAFASVLALRLAFGLALGLALCGCSHSDDNDASTAKAASASVAAASATDVTADGAVTPVKGGTLNWGVTTEPACFDPHRSSQQNAFWVIRNVVDSLIYKKKDGGFSPWLAKSWEVSPDGKTYTFVLRDDVAFTDGTTFDASAVKANLDYIRANAATTAASVSLLAQLDRVEVVSPDEVKLVLKSADSTLLESLSTVKLGFLSPKALASDQDLCAGGPGLVGTGPFVFKRYARGQSATFDRNPAYHWAPAVNAHQGPPYLDSVVYRFLPEAAVRTGALSSGQVDMIEGVQATDVSAFKGVSGFQYITGPSATTSFSLNVNYTLAPADDVRVRRALRDGFDLDAIVKNVYLGTVRRAWSDIGPDNADTDPGLVNAWGNHIAEANKLLDEAGWTQRDSDGFRTKNGKRLFIEVQYPQPYVRDARDVLIRAVQSALRQNIGLDLGLRITTVGEYTNGTATGTWIIYPNTDNASDTAMELWDMLGDKGFLYHAIKTPDAQIVADINHAKQLPVGDERRTLLRTIQARAVDQGFIVPLFAPAYHLAARTGVHGISFEPELDGPSGAYDIWLDGGEK